MPNSGPINQDSESVKGAYLINNNSISQFQDYKVRNMCKGFDETIIGVRKPVLALIFFMASNLMENMNSDSIDAFSFDWSSASEELLALSSAISQGANPNE